MDDITILQAEVLRTIAHPRRIEILRRLAAGPIEVTRLADEVGASQPNVSQHLSVLRTAGLVESDRDGREIRYRLADHEVMEACLIMRRFLERRIERLGRLAATSVPSGSPDGQGTSPLVTVNQPQAGATR